MYHLSLFLWYLKNVSFEQSLNICTLSINLIYLGRELHSSGAAFKNWIHFNFGTTNKFAIRYKTSRSEATRAVFQIYRYILVASGVDIHMYLEVGTTHFYRLALKIVSCLSWAHQVQDKCLILWWHKAFCVWIDLRLKEICWSRKLGNSANRLVVANIPVFWTVSHHQVNPRKYHTVPHIASYRVSFILCSLLTCAANKHIQKKASILENITLYPT